MKPENELLNIFTGIRKMNKTNVIRLLDARKIPYELVEYGVDEDELIRVTGALVKNISE